MEPALKQRLIGAAVLVALAVIFLPMLIKGPAPESGASDVPLELPPQPQGEFETRELPLVAPADTPDGGAVGMPVAPGQLPTVDTTTAAAEQGEGEQGSQDQNPSEMMPPPTAGGDYAVSFGSYATRADAGRVVDALRASQLPGYQESVDEDGRTLFRVRIGPYASQASAESARLRAAHVRDDVGAKVVVLDADDSGQADSEQVAQTASEPTAAEPAAVAKSEPLPESPPSSTPPAEPQAASPPSPSADQPAATDVGFAVQLGAFSHGEQAVKLRDRARAAGFSAFVEQVRTDKGLLSRVQVGPVADRAAAERLKAQVAARLGINGFVQSHP